MDPAVEETESNILLMTAETRNNTRITLLERITTRRWRITWGYAAALLLIVLAEPNPLSLSLGIPMVLFGEAIRIVANGTLVKDKELTNWGLYAHIRHPLYVGSMMIGAGFIIMAWNIYLTIFTLVFFAVVYRRTIEAEELKMEGYYGERYQEWAQSTARFFPRRWVFMEISEHFILRRAWANREYDAVMGVIAGIVILYLKYLYSS